MGVDRRRSRSRRRTISGDYRTGDCASGQGPTLLSSLGRTENCYINTQTTHRIKLEELHLPLPTQPQAAVSSSNPAPQPLQRPGYSFLTCTHSTISARAASGSSPSVSQIARCTFQPLRNLLRHHYQNNTIWQTTACH